MCVDYDRYVDTNLIKDPVSARQFVIGAICAIAAVAIWAGWLVMMRLGVTTALTAFDLTALAVRGCRNNPLSGGMAPRPCVRPARMARYHSGSDRCGRSGPAAGRRWFVICGLSPMQAS